MNRIVGMGTLAGGLLLASIPALAHHSFAAEYDSAKPVKLEGTVTKVEWLNPHMWLYLDAKDDSGKTVAWQCEGGAPNALKRQGWTRNSLNPGDKIKIEGFRAKDGSNTCSSRSVVTSDGKRLFSGSNDDGGPGSKKE
jgi:Family of unknown function (DUF6152)